MEFSLDDIQQEISADFDSSATALASTDSEYVRRRVIVNRFERIWARVMNYRWDELAKSDTITFVAGVADMPSDFAPRGLVVSDKGQIKIGSYRYDLIGVGDIPSRDGDARYVYITGDPASGYKMNINPSYDGSEVINYFTHNLATDSAGTTGKGVLELPDDLTKIPNPYYLVYSTLAQLFKDDDEGNKGVDFEALAKEQLENMIASHNLGQINENAVIPIVYETEGGNPIGA